MVQFIQVPPVIQAPSWSEELKWAKKVGMNGVLKTPGVGNIVMALGKRKVAKQWYGVALPDSIRGDAFYATAMRAFDEGGRFPLASAWRGMFSHEETDFQPVFQPTLVVWGGADRTHSRTDKRSILDHAPNAHFVEFPTAGHFPELEEPDLFRQELFKFLAASRHEV